MTIHLPVVNVALCAERLALIFPPAAFDSVLSNPLAAAGLSALIYVGAVHDESEGAEQRYLRPTMGLWLNDPALGHDSPADRDAWHRAAAQSKRKVAELEASWGITFAARYADNTRETLRDETLPQWRDYGAVVSRGDLQTSSPTPRWQLADHFAALFDPQLEGEELIAAVLEWTEDHMSTSGRVKALSAHQLAQEAHVIDVTLPGGQHRLLEPGEASLILKGVIEEWAPRKLSTPRVLTISEPGDKIYVADAQLLGHVGIEIDVSTLLPDALIVDAGQTPITFWIIEAVATGGEISESRKARLLAWAEAQGIPTASCRFLSAFTSRNSAPAKRHLKDLASGTYAWFVTEPDNELVWDVLDGDATPTLAVVTQLRP
ncbi:BsuBI/PstI family type II restriction endonuclease [Pseudolysinimonas sp.]|jgi:hypothetical protein|uniref:BsuBI/PstI family type II restriction endonuclease n=1 Tax=Pseudolysinimonas sp. TaxID=2680009 RepID=UPI003782FD25